jgi:hypothetical protein
MYPDKSGLLMRYLLARQAYFLQSFNSSISIGKMLI